VYRPYYIYLAIIFSLRLYIMNEWTKLVKKVYSENKKRAGYMLKDAMRDAKKIYKPEAPQEEWHEAPQEGHCQEAPQEEGNCQEAPQVNTLYLYFLKPGYILHDKPLC
jgi:hypothetical protein